jgi:hypothetical protein
MTRKQEGFLKIRFVFLVMAKAQKKPLAFQKLATQKQKFQRLLKKR